MQGNSEFTLSLGTGSTSACSPGSGVSVSWNNALLAAVFFVGTGGFATAQALRYVPGAPSVVRVAHELGQHCIGPKHVLDTQEKLAGIRQYFAVNMSDMAKILRVGRPTVYTWLRDAPTTLRAGHARRIDEVYGIARTWRAMSNKPVGALMSIPLSSGETLLALLSARTLDESAIEKGLAEIADAVNRKTRRASVLEIARRRGFKLATVHPIKNWASGDEVDI